MKEQGQVRGPGVSGSKMAKVTPDAERCQAAVFKGMKRGRCKRRKPWGTPGQYCWQHQEGGP